MKRWESTLGSSVEIKREKDVAQLETRRLWVQPPHPQWHLVN